MADKCGDPKFDRTQAVVLTRERRLQGERAREKFCENCRAYHVVDTIPANIKISDRERKIIFRVAQGLTFEEIATEIGATYHQVKNTVNALMIRFSTLSQANLAVWAVHNNVIDVSSFCQLEGDDSASTPNL